ncbi:MAG: hypothetical protein Q9M35_10285 [Rhodothermus sp.]|nr:hypothetical protein [Rhodothermus sp.]
MHTHVASLSGIAHSVSLHCGNYLPALQLIEAKRAGAMGPSILIDDGERMLFVPLFTFHTYRQR